MSLGVACRVHDDLDQPVYVAIGWRVEKFFQIYRHFLIFLLGLAAAVLSLFPGCLPGATALAIVTALAALVFELAAPRKPVFTSEQAVLTWLESNFHQIDAGETHDTGAIYPMAFPLRVLVVVLERIPESNFVHLTFYYKDVYAGNEYGIHASSFKETSVKLIRMAPPPVQNSNQHAVSINMKLT